MDTTEEPEDVGVEVVAEPAFGAKRNFSDGGNFSAGGVVRLTFSMFGANPLLYLMLALLIEAPAMLGELFMTEETGKILGVAAGLLLSVVFTGAIAYGVYKGLIGEGTGIGEAVSHGLSRYFSLIGLSLVLGVLVILLAFIAALLRLPGIIGVAIVILYYACVFTVATPACVVERLGPIQSLTRSAALTKGRRWSVLGLLFINGLGVSLLRAVTGFGAALVPDGGVVFEYAAALIITALTQVGISVLYYQLRSSREGVSVSKLARVFE